MRKLYYGLLLAVVLGMFAPLASAQQQGKKMQVYGVAFYNLENLFDTINNNGKYDKEFSPAGKNQWDSRRYWKKINNLGYAISQMPTRSTPMGPAVIGVSEVENITVLQDLVKDKHIADWNLQIVHHDSPDRRGIDVGLLYNPRFFKVINVKNHYLKVDSLPYFRTRDQMCVVGLLGGLALAQRRRGTVKLAPRGGSRADPPHRRQLAQHRPQHRRHRDGRPQRRPVQ